MASRRGSGEGSIYQRASDGRWLATVDLGWQGGKRKRVAVTGKTKREAMEKMRAKQRELDAGVLTDAATVEQWARHWLDTIATPNVRPKVALTYDSYVRTWIVPHLGKRKLSDLRPEHVRGMLSAMAAAGRAEATRHHAHQILRGMLEVARKEGRVMRNAAADMTSPPSLSKGSHGVLELDEALRVLQVLARTENPWPDADRWGVALLAGLRQSEALGLTWDDVALDHGLLMVERSIQHVTGRGMVIGETKSRRSTRAVPLLPAVVQLLERTPAVDRSGWLWPGRDPLWPRSPSYDSRRWKLTLAEAGVDPKPLHAARATTASLLMEAGVADVLIAEILGHAQVQVTQRHYLHGNDRVRRDAMNQLGVLLAAAPSEH